MVKCGDCEYFVRDGSCNFMRSEKGKREGRPFGEAPFWVWSDCYSDKELVRSEKETACGVFEAKAV